MQKTTGHMNGNFWMQKMQKEIILFIVIKAENPKEYTAKVTGSADDGFVVTYSHEIAKSVLQQM